MLAPVACAAHHVENFKTWYGGLAKLRAYARRYDKVILQYQPSHFHWRGEGPARIAKTGTVALKPGMILSDEPGYYKAGAYGIRIENLLVVMQRGVPEGGERELLGFENLTRAPIDRRLIAPDLLDSDERAWLDDYHAQVRADLLDLLDPATAGWLVHVTAPLG